MDYTIKLKRPHVGQRQVIAEAKRFNVLKCGRRWGKTILSEELSVKPALSKMLVGYWTPTYKDVSKVWDEVTFTLNPIISKKSEQLKQIKLITGGQIDFWSMDDPNSGRGFKYHRAIIDECEKARNFQEIWEKVIRATLADYKGDAWFLSTPKFGKSYFKEITRNKERKGFEDWNSWVKTTYDNPYLSKSEIDSARAQLDDLTFRCEYLAEDVDIVGNPFCYAFSEIKHVTDYEMQYDSGYELHLSFDFNVDPITAISSQYVDGQIRILREFRLQNSDIYQLCDQIKAAYPFALFIITGDATGQARSALTSGNINYYTVIRQQLNITDGQVKTPNINPAIQDSRVLCNSILQNFPLFINPSCTFLIDDLKYVEIDEEGKIDKDKDKHRSHLLDTFRYLLNTFHSSLLTVKQLDELPPDDEY